LSPTRIARFSVKEAGKLRLEGRDYVMRDGDMIHIRFKV
jgi:ribosome-binding ATPase YchF (GTP1/OBG family)